ncbi:hypothetical protein SCE1572_18830 [Sorangium cellulosum So0157-2]|uniref:Uncharacterized protein n=1 Tax=Sorangium cellulosum So0157-2 TaxID=1254432 RepID=S4XWU0_SORCE|nr:hypothetical protein SCE1572_18830 [Sorangium cellulosum So0157-2]
MLCILRLRSASLRSSFSSLARQIALAPVRDERWAFLVAELQRISLVTLDRYREIVRSAGLEAAQAVELFASTVKTGRKARESMNANETGDRSPPFDKAAHGVGGAGTSSGGLRFGSGGGPWTCRPQLRPGNPSEAPKRSHVGAPIAFVHSASDTHDLQRPSKQRYAPHGLSVGSGSHVRPYTGLDADVAAQRPRSQKPSPQSPSFVQARSGTS